MRKLVQGIVVAVVAAVVLVGCSDSGSDLRPGQQSGSETERPDVDPVLGRAGYQPFTVGFGTVKPAMVAFASLDANMVSDIKWESWGGDAALGVGTNLGAPSWLEASDLGWCAGVWAYRGVRWGNSQAGLEAAPLQDVCRADRANPSERGEITLGPDSLLTFGGAGGVFVRDSSSTIPETYVDKVVTGEGMDPTGTQIFKFRPDDAGEPATVYARPDGEIYRFSWYATDKGIRIGSTREEMASAYSEYPRGTCTTSSPNTTADFYRDPDTGRYLAAAFTDNRVSALIVLPEFTDGKHCGFE